MKTITSVSFYFLVAALLCCLPQWAIGQNDTITIEDIIKRQIDYNKNHVEYKFDTTKRHLVPNFTADSLFKYYGHLFGLGEHDEMRLRSRLVSPQGATDNYTHAKTIYHQYYKGILVDNPAPSQVLESHGFVKQVQIRNYELDADTTVQICEKTALEKALSLFDDEERQWRLNDPNATLEYKISSKNAYSKGMLVFYVDFRQNLNGASRCCQLAWRFFVETTGLESPWYVYVSAIDGSVIYKKNLWWRAATCDFVSGQETTLDGADVDLWNYNDLPHFNIGTHPEDKAINVEYCDFNDVGSCQKYRLDQDNTNARITTRFDETEATVDWTVNDVHIPPMISYNITPATVDMSDGAVTVFTDPLFITSFSGDLEGISGDTFSGLTSSAFNTYQLTLTSIDGCEYEEHIAIGNTIGPTVNATIINATCTMLGNIELSITPTSFYVSGTSKIEIDWHGSLSNPLGFNATTPSNNFDISTWITTSEDPNFNLGVPPNDRMLPPGNYTFIIREVNSGLTPSFNTTLHLRIERDAVDCLDIRQKSTTAYWAVSHTHDFFKNTAGTGFSIYSDPSMPVINLTAGSGSVSEFDLMNDFTHNPNTVINIRILPSVLIAGSNHLGELNNTKIDLGETTANSMMTLDVVAHEYTHLINIHAGSLTSADEWPESADESAILLEGFCDIFGVIIDATIQPMDWSILEAQFTNETVRHLSEPKANGHPNTYLGDNWCNHPDGPDEPYCGPNSADDPKHFNSTVLSYWFYLLAEGKTGTVDDCEEGTEGCKPYAITGIGINKAARIAYHALVNKLGGSDGFAEACQKTLEAAHELYPADTEGNCSAEYLAVWKAWEAVGVSCPETFTPPCTTGCLYELEYEIVENCDEATGSYVLDIEITEGIGPFTVSGDYTAVLYEQPPFTFTTTSLPEGDYSLTITDPYGCERIIAGENTCACTIPLKADYTEDCQTDVGQLYLDFTVTSGTPPYTYQINGGSQTSMGSNTAIFIASQEQANMEVTFTDANLCSQTLTVPINQCCQYSIDPAQLGVNSSGGAFPKLTVSLSLEVEDYQFPYTIILDGMEFILNEGALMDGELIVTIDWDGESTTLYDLSITNDLDCVSYFEVGSGTIIPIEDGLITGTGDCNNVVCFTNENQFIVDGCYEEEICLEYFVESVQSGEEPIIVSHNQTTGLTMTSHTINAYGPTANGIICFDPYFSGPQEVTLMSIVWIDGTNYYNTATYTLNAFCGTPLCATPCPTCTDGILNQGEESVDCAGPCPPCPTCSDGIQNQNEDEVDCGGPCLPCPCAIAGFDHDIIDAVVECDGDLVDYGEVLITPVYYYAGAENTCAYTGIAQNPVTGLAPGTHIINATLNNGLPVQIPITVGSQPIDGSYIGISATVENPLGWCLGDNCDGSIDVSFSGISGEYTITWADCAACISVTRSNLCAGTYSVTVLDEETGCSNTATFTLTAQPPASATDVQLNPTVFDNNTTVSYHMPEGAYVTLRVWHTNGTLVETLINNEYRLAGQHTEAHDGSGLTAGMYIYSIEVCNDSEGRIGVKN